MCASGLDVVILGYFPSSGIADYFIQNMVPAHCDVTSVEELLLKDLLGPEFVSSVDHGDVTRNIGEVERFFHRGVPAADDGHVLTLVEEPVAGGTGGDPFSHELLLRFQPKIPGIVSARA